MIFKFFLFLLLLTNLSYASFQKVKIGKIDTYYKNIITLNQLENIVKDIEKTFEMQLGLNVFDLSNDGKPIDILYLQPSLVEKRIKRATERFNDKLKKLEELKIYFPQKKAEIDSSQKVYDLKSKYLNEKILKLNEFIKEANKKSYSQKKYEEIKNYISLQKSDIKNDTLEKKRLERSLKRGVFQYNNKILKFNNIVREARFLSKEIESLTRNNKVVKGRTFGKEEITLKTFVKDGVKYNQKDSKKIMNKIEIYNFENINQLKAVIAHEIAHLVGITHINSKGALMNPLLQKEQLMKIHLTYEDIVNFKNNF